MDKLFKDDLQRLKNVTKNCREDMHEPDEQEIYAEFGPVVHITNYGVMHPAFDNACTGAANGDMGFWLIKRKHHDDGSYQEYREWFNLACVIALARKAVID